MVGKPMSALGIRIPGKRAIPQIVRDLNLTQMMGVNPGAEMKSGDPIIVEEEKEKEKRLIDRKAWGLVEGG